MELTAFWFGVYKLLKYLLFPYTWLVLLLGLQLLLLGPGATRRLGVLRALAVAAFAIVTVLGNPLMWRALAGPLEAQYPPFHASTGTHYDAIVVLGAGALAHGTLRPEDDLSDESRARAVCGVKRFSEGVAPVLVLSGGDASIFRSGPAEAEQMKQLAVRLGVPDAAILLETRSRTTYENARETRERLGPAAILLVTSASHMPRAVGLFHKQDFKVTAAPCTYTIRDYPMMWADATPFDVMPTANALAGTTNALMELAGTWLYKATGKI